MSKRMIPYRHTAQYYETDRMGIIQLGELYWLGYNDCLARLDEIRNYLSM